MSASQIFAPWSWETHQLSEGYSSIVYDKFGHGIADHLTEDRARLIAAAPEQDCALNYVADMTYCGADAEWHFKPGYDPQVVLDAIARALSPTPAMIRGGEAK